MYVVPSAVLLCSPEVYTSNHKTELLDEAFDAVLQRLGGVGRQYAGDGLWAWDCSKHKWCQSVAASKLLAMHHKTYWAPLVSSFEMHCRLSLN